MPRFSVKSLLVATAVIALWLSTFAGYQASWGVRAAILLVILLSSLMAAIYCGGRQRAFWIGFFATMLTAHMDSPKLRHIGDLFAWTDEFVNQFVKLPSDNGVPYRQFYAITSTVQEVIALLLSVLVGYIAAYIYDQSQQDKDG